MGTQLSMIRLIEKINESITYFSTAKMFVSDEETFFEIYLPGECRQRDVARL